MVLVDTSIWIRLFRKETSGVAERISGLVTVNEAAICGPIWAEFIGGFRSPAKRRRFEDAFGAYPWLEVTRDVFELAAQWRATRRGIGVIDAIIAATARVHGAGLLTADRSFAQFADEGVAVELFD